MPEQSKDLYTKEQAENEAQVLKEMIESGQARDYQEAENSMNTKKEKEKIALTPEQEVAEQKLSELIYQGQIDNAVKIKNKLNLSEAVVQKIIEKIIRGSLREGFHEINRIMEIKNKFNFSEVIIREIIKKGLIDYLVKGSRKYKDYVREGLLERLLDLDFVISSQRHFNLPETMMEEIAVEGVADLLFLNLEVTDFYFKSQVKREVEEIMNRFNLSKRIISNAIQKRVISYLFSKNENILHVIYRAKIIDEEFKFEAILVNPEIQKAARKGLIECLSKGQLSDARAFENELKLPPMETENEIQKAAKKGFIECLSKGQLSDARAIENEFKLPPMETENLEIQKAAEKGVIECLSKGEIYQAIEIKNVFYLQNNEAFSALINKALIKFLAKIDDYKESNEKTRFIVTEFNIFTREQLEEVESRIKKYNFINYSELYYYDSIKDKEKKESDELYKEIFEILRKEHLHWQNKDNISGPFEEGAQYFGYDKMFKYIRQRNRHDALYNFRKITKLAKQSGLNPEQFFGQILNAVAMDGSQYRNFLGSHQYLNNIADAVDISQFNEIIRKASQYQDIDKLQKLLADFEKPADIFKDWKSLKKYYELIQLLGKTEILEQLQELKKQGKDKLYNYIEILAFHPNIDMQKVFQFWQNPGEFLQIGEIHASDFHEMKKPSNYVDIPYLDLVSEELRDALVEGILDELQVWKPLEIEYELPENIGQEAKEGGKNIRADIKRALGSKQKQIKGEAENPNKLFQELNKIFKQNKLDLIKSINDNAVFIPTEVEKEIEKILYDEEIGLKKQKNIPTVKFRARINLKSDPNGVVAGNDTACCMPFGSGKNNVYTFNPICVLFTVEKEINGKWRTIAQSVLTKNADIKKNVQEVIVEMQKPNAKIHEVVPEEALIQGKNIITADNVEVTPNFKTNPQAGEILETIYRDYFQAYAKKFAKTDNLDENRLIIGVNYSDALHHLPQVDNTFVPLAPVGYSDNIGKKSLELDLTKKSEEQKIINRKVTLKFKPEREDDPGIKAKNISLLTFKDSLFVAYLEGKIYEGTSLLEGLHNMENGLIAKDINNAAKDRKNMSFKYTDEKGKVQGYIFAYEGVYNNEPVIYVSDLAASVESKMAGGRLINAFVDAYKKNYLEAGKPIPILAQARDKTSYPIIKKGLDGIAKKLGLELEMEEEKIGEDDYDDEENYQGRESMHQILIRPKK